MKFVQLISPQSDHTYRLPPRPSVAGQRREPVARVQNGKVLPCPRVEKSNRPRISYLLFRNSVLLFFYLPNFGPGSGVREVVLKKSHQRWPKRCNIINEGDIKQVKSRRQESPWSVTARHKFKRGGKELPT